IETSARVNISKAEQTITLSKLLKCNIIFNAQEGTELWDLVSRIYTMADNGDTKLAYTEPELVAFLNRGLKHVFNDRKLTASAEIGLTPDGNLIINPTIQD
ncbi:MAG TPA: Tfx family DNA-binding protein, partial [Halobacteriales archaeon]|nr:Tfx family DNA-binding protein [Halobacteriales archaeon]